MEGERLRKVYELTNEGRNLLGFIEKSLNLIYKTLVKDSTTTVKTSEIEGRSVIRCQKSRSSVMTASYK